MCFLAFSHQCKHKFLSKGIDYFSHMLQQRYLTHNHQVRIPTHLALSTKPSGWGPVKRNTVFLNSFPNKAWFLHVGRVSLLKILWEKEKLCVMCNFSFVCSVFYLFGELSAIFIIFKLVICKLFQFGRVQKLLLGKG